MVDPTRPSITPWQLRGDAYVEVADVQGAQVMSLQEPFAIDLTPAQLVDG